MQIGGVHVAVGQDGVVGQRRQGRGDGGLACAALSAYDGQLLHALTSPSISVHIFRNLSPHSGMDGTKGLPWE